jgi:hypothetical protein
VGAQKRSATANGFLVGEKRVRKAVQSYRRRAAQSNEKTMERIGRTFAERKATLVRKAVRSYRRRTIDVAIARMTKNTTQPVETIVRISEEDEPGSGAHNVSNDALADASGWYRRDALAGASS